MRGEAPVKLPKIKTLNHQIDVIEANSTATEARLACMEKLLERIAQQLDTGAADTELRHDEQAPEGHPPGL
jgi:hypothetical protein